MTNEIKIYVANLGKYNEGELVGKWFTLPIDLEEIRVAIGVAHYDEDENFIPYVEENGVTYEEWAIHDCEAPFNISEYASIEKLNEIAELIENKEDYEVEAICELFQGNYVSDFEEGFNAIDNGDVRFYHDCKDMSDIAYQLYEETGQLAELTKHINESYIDFEAIGRDMEIEGHFIELSNGVWVEYIN
ncbi:antirestriction protein ArdA [Bacillus subtilis]|uniref:antirestriction protein ArdA n=1 Tax=Bacillus subtilis TaxID=1423 RepID=UPI003CE7A3B8